MKCDPECKHSVRKHKGPNAGSASREESSIGNINGNTHMCTKPQQEPDTDETKQAACDKEEFVNMCSNVKKAIANAQERLQKTKDGIEQVRKERLGSQLDRTML